MGSRDVDMAKAYNKIDDKVILLKRAYKDDLVIVSGGARGVDRLAEAVARVYSIEFEEFPAHWRNGDGTFNRAAGFERNKRLVDAVDMVVAFWDGKSSGTKNTIEIAQKLKKRVEVVML